MVHSEALFHCTTRFPAVSARYGAQGSKAIAPGVKTVLPRPGKIWRGLSGGGYTKRLRSGIVLQGSYIVRA